MLHRHVLSNGLTVVAQRRHEAPVVAIQLWVRVGSADENADQIGLAHLHEHMLFKGTTSRGPGEVARAIEAVGGEINAWTSFDQTVYHVVLTRQHVALGVAVLADMVRHARFDQEELGREIEVVCEEMKRSDDLAARRASRELFAQAFSAHPYGRPVIGWQAQVRAQTRDRVVSFYRQHYRPDACVLSVVGDFEPAPLMQAIEAELGTWQAPATAWAPLPEMPSLASTTVALSPTPESEAHLHVAFGIGGVSHPDTPALDVLAMALGQGDASRLSLEVRRKRGLAKQASAWSWTPARASGLFALNLVGPGSTLAEALDVALGVVAAFRDHPMPAEELSVIQQAVEADSVYQRESMQGQARRLGYYQAMAGGVEREAEYLKAVATLTPASVHAAAQRALRLERCVVSGLVAAEHLTEGQCRDLLERHVRSGGKMPSQHRGEPPRRSAPPKSAPGPRLDTRLQCGARLLVQEERGLPCFAVRAAFRGGLLHETPQTNGRSALLARTWMRGAGSRGAEETSHLVDSLSGALSASVGRSSLSVRSEFLSSFFEAGLQLTLESLVSPRFDEAEVERERRQLVAQCATRAEKAGNVVNELFTQAMFAQHPYRLPPGGTVESLQHLTRAHLVAYHQQALQPAQLTLAVVGDVDAALVVAQCESFFGARASAAETWPAQVLDAPPPRVRVSRHLDKQQTHLMLGFRGTSFTDPRRWALELLATALAGQSGQLFLTLRDQRSLAYSVTAHAVDGLDPGWFAVTMATSPSKVEQAITGIREVLQTLRDEPLRHDALTRARAVLIGGHHLGLQRASARAGLLALDACYDLPSMSAARYEATLAAIDGAAVQQAARDIFQFDHEVLAIAGPDEASSE